MVFIISEDFQESQKEKNMLFFYNRSPLENLPFLLLLHCCIFLIEMINIYVLVVLRSAGHGFDHFRRISRKSKN